MADTNEGQDPTEGQDSPAGSGGQAQAASNGHSTPVVQPETPVDWNSQPVNVQNAIKDLREENKAHRLKAEKLEADAAKAQDDKLADQKKWEELATKRGDELAELDGVSEQRDDYQKQLVSSLTAQVADWPEEFKDMVPDSEDPAVIQAFITKAKPAVDKFNTTPAAPGVGSTPKPMGQPGQLTPEQEKERKSTFTNWVRRL